MSADEIVLPLLEAMILDHDGFLTELTKLYRSNTDAGSVWVTSKRCAVAVDAAGQRSMPKRSSIKDPESMCLVRATDGKRKISTLVSHAEAGRFASQHANVLLMSLTKLKKRDKTSKKVKGLAGKKA